MADIRQYFPRWRTGFFEETSPYNEDYNCIAWAAEDTKNWWEPDPGGYLYWPPGTTRDYTLAAYIEAYETLGYGKCDSAEYETGYRKLAIYVNDFGRPTHAARQLPDGLWTSKCGKLEDVKHELHTLEGQIPSYGKAFCFMKRPA